MDKSLLILHGQEVSDRSSSGIKITKLWENSDPSQSMSGGAEINLSSDDYDMLLIIYNHEASGNRNLSTIITKGADAVLGEATYNTGTGAMTCYRLMTRTSDVKYTIGEGKLAYNTVTTNNSVIIPVYVYGIKL